MRFARILVLACACFLLTAAASSAAPHMWVGFQDDPSFRWRVDRAANLDAAQQAGATVIRAWVFWPQVAPTRPTNAANPFDPAYRLDDIDELVRGAQRRGMEVLLTPWGVPSWANGGKTPNYAPSSVGDWATFVKALALRYSGRYPGYPAVRFWSIWNEPNLNQFLAPQFTGTKDTGATIYANLYRAAYGAIKSANPFAQVAIGDTSARGRDVPLHSATTQDSHSPGRFAQLLSQVSPRLQFDAWSHHPYPTTRTSPVTQRVAWPNVSLVSLPRFEQSIDKWFHRHNTPIWITEYGYETKPEQPAGVSRAQQAANARAALQIAARDPRVQMFIWFTFHDDQGNVWKSGLEDFQGNRKPGFDTFATTARPLDGRNEWLQIPSRPDPTVRVPVQELAAHTEAGQPIGVTYRVFDHGKLIAVAQPQVPLDRDGWITLSLRVNVVARHTYTVQLDIGDAHGDRVSRTLTLVA